SVNDVMSRSGIVWMRFENGQQYIEGLLALRQSFFSRTRCPDQPKSVEQVRIQIVRVLPPESVHLSKVTIPANFSRSVLIAVVHASDRAEIHPLTFRSSRPTEPWLKLIPSGCQCFLGGVCARSLGFSKCEAPSGNDAARVRRLDLPEVLLSLLEFHGMQKQDRLFKLRLNGGTARVRKIGATEALGVREGSYASDDRQGRH